MKQRGRFTLLAAVWCGFAVLAPGTSSGKESIITSPHNLSASGGSGKHGIKFDEVRVCVFCHAPHNARPKDTIPAPLWSRDLPSDTKEYTMYHSTTFDTAVTLKSDKPTGASRLCLSCHDGTIALNSYRGRVIVPGGDDIGPASNAPTDDMGPASYMPTDTRYPTWNPRLGGGAGNDFSDNHPISFSYTAGLAAIAQLALPSALPPQIRLELGESLQCISCHDPHNNEFGNFLVMDNNQSGSPLCMACHNGIDWRTSGHYPLQAQDLDGSRTFGCMNCHYTHNAPAPDRLLHSPKGVDNCITSACHNNGTAPVSANVQPVFAMIYRHPVSFYAGDHDAKEVLPAQKLHVECVDCHNPHQANRTNVPLSFPPAINGTLKGVRGVSKDTKAAVIATAEYEICFKCHSGVNAASFRGTPPETPPNRMQAEPDEMRRFDSLNTTSYHPVTAQRRGNGASLLGSYRTDMQRVYCSDCHNSDQSSKATGGTGSNGPHGSQYEHILIAGYDMPVPVTQSPTYQPVFDFNNRYALCFRCHDSNYVMGSSSGFYNSATSTAEHTKHVQERGIPCFACHDPHGVTGMPATVSSHLINFSKDYAYSLALPNPTYIPTATGGSCTVVCHSTGNKTETYTR